MENKSEVARILQQIAEEYEAGQQALYGQANGTTRHRFITARMETMGKLQGELEKLVGDDQANAMIAMRIDQLSEGDIP